MLRNNDLKLLVDVRNYVSDLGNSKSSALALQLDELIQRESQLKKSLSERSNQYNKTHKEKHREQCLKSYYKRKSEKATDS